LKELSLGYTFVSELEIVNQKEAFKWSLKHL